MTYIELKQDYGGRRTREQRIAPGVYHVDELDARFPGLSDYLLENGVAVEAAFRQDDAPEVPPVDDPEEAANRAAFLKLDAEDRQDGKTDAPVTSVTDEGEDEEDPAADEAEAEQPKSKKGGAK